MTINPTTLRAQAEAALEEDCESKDSHLAYGLDLNGVIHKPIRSENLDQLRDQFPGYPIAIVHMECQDFMPVVKFVEDAVTCLICLAK